MLVKQLCAVLFAVGMVSQPSARGNDIATQAPLLGMWANVDPETRGVTRLVITEEDGRLFVRAYGACFPTDCDWGTVSASLRTDMKTSEKVACASWGHTFKDSHVIVRRVREGLEVTHVGIYKDSSNRAHDVSREVFKRER